MQYKEQQPESNKILCLEILKVGSIEFNGSPTTIDLYVNLLDKFPDLHFEFYDLSDLYQFIDKVNAANIHYRWHYPADSYNMLQTLLRIGVSDILLDEPLVFDMVKVCGYIKDKSPTCKIHIRPDVGKPGWMLPDESIVHHFWLLPQYVYLYEPYVDVIDLFAESVPREMRLVESFCIKHEYEYELYALVLNYAEKDKDIWSGWITDETVERRLNCRQICMSTCPQKCHQCDIDVQASRMLRLGRHKPQSQS